MGTQLGHSDTVGTSSGFVKRERVPHFGTHGPLVSSAPAVSTGDPPDTSAQETGKAPKPSGMHTSTSGCITRRSLEELQDSKHPKHGLPELHRAQHGTAGGWRMALGIKGALGRRPASRGTASTAHAAYWYKCFLTQPPKIFYICKLAMVKHLTSTCYEAERVSAFPPPRCCLSVP